MRAPVEASLFAIMLYIVGMSKNLLAWSGLLVVATLVACLALYTNLFDKPGSAPEGDIHYGFFDGSDSFASSLTAKSQLAAVGSLTSRHAAPPESLSGAKDNLSDAIVNIICASKNGGVKSISGSGVVIDPDGVIITNAHIAQLFLLEDHPSEGNVVCVVRTGAPARTAYFAELIYISKPWVEANSTSLVVANPRGNGKNDIALLSITRSATGAPLPAEFAYVPFGEKAPKVGDAIAIGAYGAQSLTTAQIKNSLMPTLVLGSVRDVYTFGGNTVDLISLGGSDAAQHGSSGGGIVDAQGDMVALITTSTTVGAPSERDLRAVTAGHVRESFEEDMGLDLDEYLATYRSENLVTSIAERNEALRLTLTKVLGGVAMR